MTLHATLERVRHSPRLPQIVQSLAAQLQVETAARRAFYQDMTDEQKVEFIAGEVVFHSSARSSHMDCQDHVRTLLKAYVRRQNLGRVYGEKCLCVFPRNDYEPDVVYFGPAKAASITPATMRFPVPDLAVEILSPSTAERDRGVKFEDFAANGVDEYWIIDADACVVEQYLAREGAFELNLKSGSGELASRAILGLRLPIRSFFDEAAHEAAVLAVMTG